MLWLANTGDDNITNEGEEYSSKNVLNQHHCPHCWYLRDPQSTPQAIDQGVYLH